MKKSTSTEAQIVFALLQADGGVKAEEVCRKMGTSEATFYNWKKKFGGLGVNELAGCGSWKKRTTGSKRL